MVRSKYYVIGFLILLVAVLGVFWWHTHRQNEVASATADQASFTPLTGPEYRAYVAKFVALTSSTDPRTALLELQKESDASPALAAQCHPIAHEIGHAAYAKYGSFGAAMQYQNETCNSGYMHGVIESYLNTASGTVQIIQKMQAACGTYATGTFADWECAHGLGHGAMFATNNDVPQSIAFCRLLEDQFSSDACVNGVFMENFNTDPDGGFHTSEYEDPNDPFYPCSEQAAVDKNSCYTYAPVYYLFLHNENYQAAFQWCTTAESGYVHTCAEGVGNQLMKDDIDSVASAESICNAAPDGMRSDCIGGLVSYDINYYGALDPATALCGAMLKQDQDECKKIIMQNTPLFNKTSS